MCSKVHHQVVAAVIVSEDEILCMQRGQTKFEYTSFKWEFPGGKVEPKETPEDALIREIREEMAMDISVVRHLITVEYEYPDFQITMAAYLCAPVTDRRFIMREHNAFKWLPISDLHTLDWAGADVAIMKKIKSL